MLSRKSFLVIAVTLLFISNISLAVMCARLKSVSAGEYHTLALADDNTLWACGGSSDGVLGLGNVGDTYSLQQVLGEDGEGFLENVVTFDAGWQHSLAADANGTIWAWGDDSYGQLGNGAGNYGADVPERVRGIDDVNYLSDTVDIIYVSAGRSEDI